MLWSTVWVRRQLVAPKFVFLLQSWTFYFALIMFFIKNVPINCSSKIQKSVTVFIFQFYQNLSIKLQKSAFMIPITEWWRFAYEQQELAAKNQSGDTVQPSSWSAGEVRARPVVKPRVTWTPARLKQHVHALCTLSSVCRDEISWLDVHPASLGRGICRFSLH